MEAPKPKAKPKTPPTKRKSRAAKLSQEQILLALKKKKECNARAQKIVETFLDPVPLEKVEYFLSCLVHINQSHYDDIVEERSIVKLCGYPLCDDSLKTIPKQQFVISTAQNKVYDITERKKFCSNKCFKSSVYLREQILTSPLWVRKEDDILPEFKLLSFNEKDDDKKDIKNNEKKEDKNNDINENKNDAKSDDKNGEENDNKKEIENNDKKEDKNNDINENKNDVKSDDKNDEKNDDKKEIENNDKKMMKNN